jgi:outer membrane protein assembly factor BamB
MEESGFGFDEFSVEMGNFRMRKVRKFDRLWRITTGGSIDQFPLVHDGKVYFGSLNHNLYCLDAETGRFFWKFKARDRIGISSPAVFDGIIFVGSYDQNMYAINANSGELVWKFMTRGEVLSSPVVMNGTVYFGSKDKNIFALDARTGAVKWKLRTMGEILSDATTYDGKVMIGSYDRNLYCLDGETGAVVWKFRTEQEIVNSGRFAIKDGFLYLSCFDNYLRKIDVETGREVWKKRLAQYGLTCGTVIHGDMLLLPVRDGIMFGLDLDGNVRWKFSTTKPIGTPVVHDGRVYFTSEDYNFYCLSLEGRVVWKYKTQGATWWKPAIFRDNVYFGSYDCFFYALNSATGELVWRFRTQGQPSTGPGPYEEYELTLMVPEKPKEEAKKKAYDLDIPEEGEEGGRFYKSRVTYQVSTRYREKGKYQIDSDEEAF